MLRFGLLLSFAMVVLGQVVEQPAYVRIETTATGDLRGTLTVPRAKVPAELPATFARAVGCDIGGLQKSRYEPRIVVRCPGVRSSALTFHAAVRLAELAPLLRQSGIEQIDLVLTTPHFRWVHLDPVITSQGSRSGGYYQVKYSLDQTPEQILIDGGFEVSQVRTLAVWAVGFILAPFLILLLRPSDPVRLHVQMEGFFVLGWICWIWALLRVEAGVLLSYVFGRWATVPLLLLIAPPLMAVWIGSRLAAAQYVRLTPTGLGVDYYRRMKFWTGAAVTCVLSTLVSILLSTSVDGPGSLVVGFVLAIACVFRLSRLTRGGSHPLSQGDLRKRMFELAAKAGVSLRAVSIMTSPTPRPPAAFATRWGTVLLNDGLLRNLSRREVDAIVCHELSHIRPVKRSALAVVYLLLVGFILGAFWFPSFVDIIPVLLLAAYFLIKVWRRAGETKADLDSVRWSGDPEAMITGLARVSRAHGIPFEWGAPISWMMRHPATMDRIRAIARAGSLSDSRIAELLEESQRDPADHYLEAQAPLVPEDAAFSPAMRRKLKASLTWYLLLAPVALGLPAVWLLERVGLQWWAVLTFGSLFSALAMYVGSEWIVGSIRDVAKQRAVARNGQGVFAGFSPAAEPRLFDGMYHYDLGIVRFEDEALVFAGDRARFAIDRRVVRRVWLGDGARHWVPRKVVYIECQPSPEAGPVIFSLQSLEAWFWPSTVTMAKRLHRKVEEWHRVSSPPEAPALPCPLPQVEGNPNTSISFQTAFRSVGIYSGVAFFLASIGPSFEDSKGFWDPSQVLCPVVVCGLLALFLLWPRLRWGRLDTLADSQSRLPADS